MILDSYNKEILKVFGSNISLARKTRNWSLMDLAIKADYSRIYLKKVECGEKDIQLDTAIKLARALDVSFPKLFQRRESGRLIEEGAVDNEKFQEDDYLLIFSENVKAELRRKRKNQYSLYSQAGIDPSTLSRILNMKVKSPRISTLTVIADGVQ